jgi:hypothetical protein
MPPTSLKYKIFVLHTPIDGKVVVSSGIITSTRSGDQGYQANNRGSEESGKHLDMFVMVAYLF